MRRTIRFSIYILLVIGFIFAFLNMTKRDIAREKETLLNAVERDISAYYATEGYYPDNVKELEAKYNLTYDKEKYYIGYEIFGTNIRPYVTIVNLREDYE